jgi:hypothetical protein
VKANGRGPTALARRQGLHCAFSVDRPSTRGASRRDRDRRRDRRVRWWTAALVQRHVELSRGTGTPLLLRLRLADTRRVAGGGAAGKTAGGPSRFLERLVAPNVLYVRLFGEVRRLTRLTGLS